MTYTFDRIFELKINRYKKDNLDKYYLILSWMHGISMLVIYLFNIYLIIVSSADIWFITELIVSIEVFPVVAYILYCGHLLFNYRSLYKVRI